MHGTAVGGGGGKYSLFNDTFSNSDSAKRISIGITVYIIVPVGLSAHHVLTKMS